MFVFSIDVAKAASIQKLTAIILLLISGVFSKTINFLQFLMFCVFLLFSVFPNNYLYINIYNTIFYNVF